MIRFEIPGCPVPWAASRVGRRGAVDPRHKEKINITWQIKLLAGRMLVKFPMKGPVRLSCTFYMQIPHTGRIRKKMPIKPDLDHHTKKPDLTNLCKLYEDMLQRAGILSNDSQVVESRLYKFYGERPRTVIKVENVGSFPMPPDWA